MKNQEMFDEIWDRVVVQKIGPSYDKDTELCMYRGPDGNKCFAGVFIPDNLYNPEMERRKIDLLIERIPELSSIFEEKNFARDLQNAHDNTPIFGFTDRCRKKLKIIAEVYHLKIPE